MISFVVPAHDEERLLGRTLDSIHAAARAVGQPYELIVVDDASTDGTSAVAAAAGARVVRVEFRQIARTRNAGAREASGEILIFVDADTLVTAAVVQGSLDALERGAAGGGANVRFDGRLPLWARLVIPVLGAVMSSAKLAAGCYIFSSRDAFEKVGGFDETVVRRRRDLFQPHPGDMRTGRDPPRDGDDVGPQAAVALGLGDACCGGGLAQARHEHGPQS